ncbi:LysR family transcriptional regulator [Pararoseomonas indoligenes]|uniref:LysR family transcriptional regulator n=1 Tax=Roseomonas indoligenes TaxID=2820811 RepID=A0A940S403_9PROT|nr:LysR family transcriptional regulator [Pararoseomonas indoligenes]MBP0491500.1 LysR family transcriptional regulator [Pararoseomonas indoligenes]
MDLTTRQLRAFLAVAECGGFTAAARRMGWVQSAVSAGVAELETAIGARLFERSSRRVALTVAGERFRPRAAALLADLAGAVEAAKGAQEAPRLVIATVPLLAATLLPGGIGALRRAVPAVRPALLEVSATEAQAMVAEGAADLAVGTFPPTGDAGLIASGLGRDALMLFLPAGHALATGTRPLPWRAVEGEAEIALTARSALRELVDAARLAAGIPPCPPAFEVAQMSTAIALVAAGLGIAALPEAAVPLAPRGGVRVRPLDRPAVQREITLIHRAGAAGHVLSAVEHLGAVLEEALRRRMVDGPGRRRGGSVPPN